MPANRATRRQYSGLYSLVPGVRDEGGFWLCTYCGDPADQLDHVPPLSRVDDYRALYPSDERYLMVRCCCDCNRRLANSLQLDLAARMKHLKALLSRHGKRLFAADVWDSEDLEELGPNLRSAIGSDIRKAERLRQRIAYGAA